jgi:two-component system OmpR family response regulator
MTHGLPWKWQRISDPNVCVLDLNMPGMAGDELAVQLMPQPDWRPTLMVAMTAMSDAVCRERTTAAGFHSHLVKPVDPEQLLSLVRQLVAICWDIAKA